MCSSSAKLASEFLKLSKEVTCKADEIVKGLAVVERENHETSSCFGDRVPIFKYVMMKTVFSFCCV